MRGIVFLALVALIGSGGATAYAQDVETTREGGVHSTTFRLPEGQALVFLPGDAAAGDQVSGTVYVTPEGDSEKTLARNAARMKNYVLDIGGVSIVLDGDGGFSLTLPNADDVLGLTMRSVKRQTEVASATLLLAESPGLTPDTFDLPTIGQTGRYLEITGPFDGELSTTRCSVGGLDVLPLAESPRKSVFVSPQEIVGEHRVELWEGDTVVASGDYRSLDVQVAVDKLRLAKGEVTMFTVDVAGLEDLDEPVDLQIQIWPPSVVVAEGGNLQTLTILPTDVREDGRYVAELSVTGQQPGTWDAVPTVVAPSRKPPR